MNSDREPQKQITTNITTKNNKGKLNQSTKNNTYTNIGILARTNICETINDTITQNANT